MSAGRVALLFFLSVSWFANCAPPTCYSRVLGLSKEIMVALDKMHKHNRTKLCAEFLPKMFLDVHNSCIMAKLRDFLYVAENLPVEDCRERPIVVYLKRKARVLYIIINRVCFRDLVYLTDDCEALDTGYSSPRYTEDRLQILEETD
ncbi:cytokine-like protein 1 [Electrophorus electricus]|uniref:Cytokine like 1 n=1 Tax=Electrophorus electricus TaxID=8005 RepID=A0A4W4H283_ELEEL|nr:cytokine-like protein 1 [Electrophorus electricus]